MQGEIVGDGIYRAVFEGEGGGQLETQRAAEARTEIQRHHRGHAHLGEALAALYGIRIRIAEDCGDLFRYQCRQGPASQVLGHPREPRSPFRNRRGRLSEPVQQRPRQLVLVERLQLRPIDTIGQSDTAVGLLQQSLERPNEPLLLQRLQAAAQQALTNLVQTIQLGLGLQAQQQLAGKSARRRSP